MATAVVIALATAALVVAWRLFPLNRRAVAVALAHPHERRRALPFALSIAALLSGPLAPLVALIVFVVLVVERRRARGDPLFEAARANAVVAFVVGGAFLLTPFVVGRLDP